MLEDIQILEANFDTFCFSYVVVYSECDSAFEIQQKSSVA